MATVDERIKALELKLEQARAHKQKIEARQRAAAAKKNKAADTRKKVLLGAWLCYEINRDLDFAQRVRAGLNAWLNRPDDRALFGLDPLPGQAGQAGGDSNVDAQLAAPL